jgi:hypothetical protein
LEYHELVTLLKEKVAAFRNQDIDLVGTRKFSAKGMFTLLAEHASEVGDVPAKPAAPLLDLFSQLSMSEDSSPPDSKGLIAEDSEEPEEPDPVASVVTDEERDSLLLTHAGRVRNKSELITCIARQTWIEVGKAIRACLVPRNVAEFKEYKKARRNPMPRALYEAVLKPMLRGLSDRTVREITSASHKYSFLDMGNLQKIIKPNYLWARWGKSGMHEGATATLKCSETHPVYFSCRLANGVLTVQYTVEVVKPDGGLILSTRQTVNEPPVGTLGRELGDTGLFYGQSAISDTD